MRVFDYFSLCCERVTTVFTCEPPCIYRGLPDSNKTPTHRAPKPPGQRFVEKKHLNMYTRYFAKGVPLARYPPHIKGMWPAIVLERSACLTHFFLACQGACLDKDLVWIFWGTPCFFLDFCMDFPL